ncbi:hypothetical protein EUTSA_v10021954mg [Eutrema salsugineum]|uniref:Uncharacterized protein n=1 Tax=Eutrema salsugineum TaxID=72664 RepID=V4M210_EUTSA|nr:hypothetical protein EUTSA_v10021954mg [Eutrema salsugineum]
MKDMKKRTVRNLSYITSVRTLKQAIALHKSNIDHIAKSFLRQQHLRTLMTKNFYRVLRSFLSEFEEKTYTWSGRFCCLTHDGRCGGYLRRKLHLIGSSSSVSSRYIGGADEVVALNENGKLKKLFWNSLS